MTITVFTLPALATATAGILGHDWDAAPVGPWEVSGFISHRDSKHNGFLVAVNSDGDLYVQGDGPDPLAVLQDVSPYEENLTYVAERVASVIVDSLQQVPVELDGPLSYETLEAIRREADRLMTEHTEHVLPRHVLGAVTAALSGEQRTAHGAPQSAVLGTIEQDEGDVWHADQTEVRFADGTTVTVSLPHPYGDPCRNHLVRHALASGICDGDTLTVTFDPPALDISN
ncbi:hypothetical protein [Streptomyces zaomyceticus]|uniref:hypothetical protein n=1 Tax=Streptomyces zaomyceticus TaxID=68286 RepID=UPI002E1C89D1